jgi:hypothetical protein
MDFVLLENLQNYVAVLFFEKNYLIIFAQSSIKHTYITDYVISQILIMFGSIFLILTNSTKRGEKV